MTYNVNFSTVATSIAGITITGIPIRNVTTAPSNAMLQCPVLIPDTSAYITNVQPILPETYGTGGTEKLTLRYDVNYVYLHAPVGMNPDFGGYDDVLINMASIMAKFMETDVISGAIDLRVNGVPGIGKVTDGAGNEYWGCLMSFSITQLGEV